MPVRNIFIVNEIWAHIGLYFIRHFAWLKYFSYHLVLVLAPNNKQHILSPAEVRKVCSSVVELYVISVYLNFLGGGVVEKIIKHLMEGAQAKKVWEPLF
jgi:hypothetical protein